jgi:hypothetical protein
MQLRIFLLFILLIIICILTSLLYVEYFSPSIWDTNTELIIVSAHWNENLDWLTQIDIPVIVCGKDGEEKASIDSNPTCKTTNKGFEVSSYLRFIVTHYDNLPHKIAFIHGHQTAWHQKKDIIETLQKGEWKQSEYTSLNNFIIDDWKKGHSLWDKLYTIWPIYFKNYLNIDLPERLYSDCCAQFVVSRNRIHKHPKEAYEKWFNLVMGDHTKYDMNNKDIAVGFEWIWHIIFGEPAVREYV